jgi:circadian clock protein KaiC
VEPGTIVGLFGESGCGKSTLAIRYAASATERGLSAAVFAFDETLNTLVRRAKGLGMDLEPHIKSGKLILRQVDAAELSPGQFVHAISDLVNHQDVKLVILDSLNGFLNAMPGEKYLFNQLHELAAYLNQQGVITILVLAQHGLVAALEAPVDLSYLCDMVCSCSVF